MKRPILLAWIALASTGATCTPAPHLWELPPPAPQDLPVVDEARLHQTRLANGLRILVMEDHRFPAVDIGLSLTRGRMIESPSEAGVAEFTAELMQRGAGDLDALALAEAVGALGATMSVQAGWDSMGVAVGGLSRDREPLLGILADVALRPSLAPDEAERVREIQLAGIQRAGDDPNTLVAWTFFETLYPGIRPGLPSSGTPDSVSRLDAEAARAFHARVFQPGGAILWAAGDLSADEFVASAEAAFGSWPAGEVVPAAPPLPTTGERRIVVIDWPELGQAQIAFGHEGISRKHPDRLAVQILNTTLGSGGFQSRLMSSVRAEEGLTYGIFSQFAQRRAGGPFVVTTFTEARRVSELLEIAMGELARIRTEPPEGDEVVRAKSLRAGRFALAHETSAAVAASLVDLEIYDLPRDTLDTYRGRVRAVGPEELATAARSFIHPDRASIVVVGPADIVVPLLEAYGEVEVRER